MRFTFLHNLLGASIGAFYKEYILDECLQSSTAQANIHQGNLKLIGGLGVSKLMDSEEYSEKEVIEELAKSFRCSGGNLAVGTEMEVDEGNVVNETDDNGKSARYRGP